MKNFIKNLFRRKTTLGLLPLPEDKRDFLVESVLGWSLPYKTKQAELTLPVPFYKSQFRNTCVFNSGTAEKECDEGVELAQKNAVKRGRQLGYISGDGFSNLRSLHLITTKYGICEKQYCEENTQESWNGYSNPIFTDEENKNAELHKSASFLKVSTVDQLLKFLDEGRTVQIGIQWKNTFNSNYLDNAFTLDYSKGSPVGAHAILARGYKDNGNLIRCRNSYGKEYGLDGDFYIRRVDLQREMNMYGSFVEWDLPKDVTKWLNDVNGKIFQEPGTVNIFKIEGGKKRLFPDPAVMYAHGFTDEEINHDENGILALVEKGEDMQFFEGSSVMAIKAIILRKNELKPIFIKYFSELL